MSGERLNSEKVFLWSAEILINCRALYRRYGFTRTHAEARTLRAYKRRELRRQKIVATRSSKPIPRETGE